MNPAYYFLYLSPQNHNGIVAWLALALSLASLGWMIWSELTSGSRRRADEYWYRSVLAPNCIDPIISLMDDFLGKLSRVDFSHMSVDESKSFCDEFSIEKESVLEKLWLSKIFDDNYYDFACKKLDKVEDVMCQSMGSWYVGNNSDKEGDIAAIRFNAIKNITEILGRSAKIKTSFKS